MGSKITFYLLLNYLITVADLCRSKTPLFIYDYIKIHYFNLIQVREGPQGKNLSLCTYYFMYVERKLKFIPSKGQLISKCLMVSSLSPKKRTNEFALSTQTAFRGAKRRLAKKANSFVCFLGESAGHF